MASPSVVGFVGLDELSLELASSLIRSGFLVQGYEVVDPLLMHRFLELGGAKCTSPMDAARDWVVVENDEAQPKGGGGGGVRPRSASSRPAKLPLDFLFGN